MVIKKINEPSIAMLNSGEKSILYEALLFHISDFMKEANKSRTNSEDL